MICSKGTVSSVCFSPRNENDLKRKETPIEEIFSELMKRKMTPSERRILLPKPKRRKRSGKRTSERV
jgi:hypothetical protein